MSEILNISTHSHLWFTASLKLRKNKQRSRVSSIRTMDINSRNLGQQEEDLDKKKFRKRASMSRSTRQGLFMCRGCWCWWWGKSGDGTVTSYSQEPVPVPWPSKAWQMAPHCTDHLHLATSHLTLIRWDTLYSAIDHSSTCPSRSHLST